MRFIAGFFAALALVAVAGGIFIVSGAYNVSATEPHTALTRSVFSAAMQRSVKAQAQTINPPPVPNSQKIGEAFRAFDEMCVQCHGAPGKEPGVIGQGLQPRPPTLGDSAHRWKRAELFWIVKNGIKMTGMPAFGPTHSDDQIWLLVAFLQRFPNISSADYKQMEEQHKGKAERSAGTTPSHQHGQ